MSNIDPRLTDDELIASFTPKQKAFYQWYTAAREEINSSADDRVREARLLERFPSNEELEEFLDWKMIWYGRHVRRMRYQMPVNEYLDLIEQTRFDKPDSMGKFLWSMEMGNMPFIELGSSNIGGESIGFGISPGAYYLWPNLDAQLDEPGLLDRCVLGINLNVRIQSRPMSAQPVDRRRQQRSSDDSVESAESDDIKHGQGFTFVQIGALCVYGSNGKDHTDPDAIVDGPWSETGFGVVVELSPSAELGPVWVIYNFHEESPDYASDEHLHIRVYDSHGAYLPHIGRLHSSSTVQFTVAKIASSLAELRKPRQNFKFDIAARHECQIVRAKLLGLHQQISRQYIDKVHVR